MTSNLFTLKKNLIVMMRDRGYDVSGEVAMLEWTESDFVEYFENQLTQVKSKVNRPQWARFYHDIYEGGPSSIRGLMSNVYQHQPDGQRMAVIFVEPSETGGKIGIQPIRLILKAIEVNNIDSAIFVFPGKTTPDVRAELTRLKTRHYQIFQDFRLAFNPTKHNTVPKYRRLTPEEKASVLTTAGVSLRQVQTMLVTDAISKWYDYRVGDLVFIDNDKMTINKDVLPKSLYLYRTIIDAPEEDF